MAEARKRLGISELAQFDLTEIQDRFAYLIAKENPTTRKSAIKLYRAIPGVDANLSTANDRVKALLETEKIKLRIRAYRKALNPERTRLYADREYVTDRIIAKYENNEVDDNVVLSALSGREKMYGVGQPKAAKSIQIELPDDAIEAAFQVLEQKKLECPKPDAQ
jgi:hypothetical protein